MEPHPRLALLTTPTTAWSEPCSALVCLEPPKGLVADVAIIGPTAAKGAANGLDGYWTADPAEMKALRKSQPDAQLVGLAQDRHEAMVMGEAGADLVMFGSLSPLTPGELELARWWAELFEIPCACLIPAGHAVEGFGHPGEPEFYLELP